MTEAEDLARLEAHADALVDRILSGDPALRSLALELGELWRASSYRSGRLSLWHALGQAVALVEAGEEGGYEDVDDESLDEVIRREAALYREFAGVAVPDDLAFVSLCERCGHVAQPEVEQPRRVFRPPPPRVSCARCGGIELAGAHDHAGRRALLAHLRRVSGGGSSGA